MEYCLTEQKSANWKKRLSLTVKTLIGVTLLFWVFKGQDWPQIWKAVKGLNLIAVLIGLFGFIFAQFFVAARWNILLRSISVSLSFLTALRLHFLGLFYNNVMPSSVGGDLLRAWYVSKHTDRRVEAAFSVFFDRIIGLFCLLLMAVTMIFAVLGTDNMDFLNLESSADKNKFQKYLPYLFILIAIFIITALLVLIVPSSRKLLLKHIKSIYSRAVRASTVFLVYLRRPQVFLWAVVLTLFAQSMNIVALWWIGRALGLDVDIKYYFVVFPVTWVVGAIPVSPGGLGTVEGAMTLMFSHFGGEGVDTAAIAALALLHRFFWLTGSLPGLFIHLGGTHLPKNGQFFVDVK